MLTYTIAITILMEVGIAIAIDTAWPAWPTYYYLLLLHSGPGLLELSGLAGL